MQHLATHLQQPIMQQSRIHTSQIPSTSGLQTTLTTDSISVDAEESSQSDDDQLSWQEVTGRGRKRTNQSNTRTMPSKKNKPHINSNQYQETATPTNNFFSPLLSEESTDNIQGKKEPAPPPILVPGIKNAQRLMTTIEEKIRREDYKMKIINNDMIKILTTKLEDHKEVVDTLKTNKVEFHTYQPRQQRAYRVVIRYIHYSIEQENLINEIEAYGHKVRNLWNIKHRVTRRPLSLFFVDLEPAGNNKEIYNITYLQNMRIQIEPPHQKKNNIPQCKKCQGYFHTKGYCEHKPRCVKCGNMHNTENCKLPRTEPAKCVHCGEGHPANYRGCKVYQEIIAHRFPSSKPIINNHRLTNSVTQENMNLITPKQNGIEPGVTYAQVTKNDRMISTCSANIQGDTLVKLMQDSFTRFEAILTKQAEQMSSLMNLLTTVLTKLVR
jgi:hypothetical protein